MTPLRQQMLDAMAVRGMSPRTQETYVDSLARMARHLKRSPDQLTAKEIEAYMVFLVKERKLSFSSVNHVAAASRCLFTHVMDQPETGQRLLPPVARAPQKRPELLSREQIAQLFAHGKSPMMRMLLQTLYAGGLRITEGLQLRVADVDSARDRMCPRASPTSCSQCGRCLAYLSRYTHRTAIGNARIKTITPQSEVVFSVRADDHGG